MAYQGITTELPCGLAGMVQRANRLHADPRELYDAEGVTFEDNGIRREAGAVLLDSSGVGGTPGYTGTLSTTTAWAAALATFPGSGIATGGTTASGTKPVANTVCAITVPVGGYASGSFLVVTVHGGLSPDSVLDSQGNTYTLVKRSASLTRADIWTSLLTTTLNASDIVQATFLTAPGALAVAIAANFTGVTGTVGATGASNGLGTAVNVGATQAITVPSLLISAVSNTNAASSTPGSSFTELADVANGSTLRGNANFRIDTSTPTIIALADWHSGVVTTPAGTVDTTAGSDTVTGTGTTFTAHAPGDTIVVAGESRTIEAIAGNTSLTTTETWLATNAAASYQRQVGGRLITATTAGNLFKDKPTSLTMTNIDATTLKSGLQPSANLGRFISAGKEAAAQPRKLFYMNGVDRVQVLSGDGTTTTNISTPPSDWPASQNPFQQPINGIVHNFRLAGFGNLNDPHRLYFSTPTDHENFTGTGSFQLSVRSSIGDRLYGATAYNGMLFLWKYPRGIFYLDDADLTITNWSIRTVSEALGCAPSPHAVLPIDNDVLFMAADGGVHLLSAVDTLGGIRTSDLAYKLNIAKWLRDNVNLGRLDQTSSIWYPHKRLAEFFVPGTGETTPTLTLKFDFGIVDEGGNPRFSYSRRDAVSAVTVRRDPIDKVSRPVIGEAGFVFRTEQAARSKEGAAFTTRYRTPALDMSHVSEKLKNVRKNFDAIELVFDPDSTGTLTVQPYVDGVVRGPSFTVDATKRTVRKQAEFGAGRTLEIEGVNEVVDEDPIVLAHRVSFRPGNEAQDV